MQILQHFITPAVLAPLFFTITFVVSLATPDPIALKPYTYNLDYTNKDSTPDCAASSTVIDNLPYEFWIEVVFLEPPLLIDGSPLVYRPGNPLRMVGGINSASGAFYNGVFIAETFLGDGSFDVRELFKLDKNFLFNSDTYAGLWLGTNDDEPDSDSLFFDFVGDPRKFPDFLAFRAVKVCNSNNETELQLRAQRSEFTPDAFKFSNSPADYVQFEADILGKIFTPANLNGTSTKGAKINLLVRPVDFTVKSKRS